MCYKMKKRSHILIVAPTQGVYGGIEATVLAQGKAVKDTSHYSLRIIFKLVSGFKMQQELIDIFDENVLSFQVVNRLSFNLLYEIFAADVVHGHNASPDVVLFSKLLGKPLLLTIHNKLTPDFSMHYYLWKIVSGLSDFKTYNSSFVKKTWEIDECVYNSCIIPTVSNLPQKEYSVKNREGFLFISRWVKNKGIDELVQSFEKANINKIKWPLTMVGKGPEKERIEKYIKNGVENRIKLIGFVTEEEKFEYIRKSKWVIAPPNTQEDLGLTPIEARNFGIPSIVTRDGGLPESAGPSALVCEPGNVEDLTKCIEKATLMSEEEYENRSKEAMDSLKSFLKPISIYSHIYKILLNES